MTVFDEYANYRIKAMEAQAEQAKTILDWCVENLGIIIPLFLIFGFVVIAAAAIHAAQADQMHYDHNRFVLRQETCIAHDGWYTPDENYHGLLACRRLSDHSLFYIVEDTGLELERVE